MSCRERLQPSFPFGLPPYSLLLEYLLQARESNLSTLKSGLVMWFVRVARYLPQLVRW